jgi:hypothetical protein
MRENLDAMARSHEMQARLMQIDSPAASALGGLTGSSREPLEPAAQLRGGFCHRAIADHRGAR